MEYSYEDSIKISQQALDLIDIKKFLISGKEICEVIYNIEDYFENSDEEEIQKLKYFMKDYPDIFGKTLELFNYIDDDEFISYCRKRYPDIYWGEEIIERYWVR